MIFDDTKIKTGYVGKITSDHESLPDIKIITNDLNVISNICIDLKDSVSHYGKAGFLSYDFVMSDVKRIKYIEEE